MAGRLPWIALICLAALTACGQPGSEGPTVADQPVPSLVPDDYHGRFRTFATVLESTDHGPQLCHAVADSLPPQCSGPDIVGWDWSVAKHEEASGTRWGAYVLVGTFDGTEFTLTEPATVDDGSAARPLPPDMFDTPCPEPPDGWQPVDPPRASEEALQRAVQIAQGAEGYGGLWVDQRLDDSELTEANANDPQRLVLNVSTTGDTDEVQSAIREVWGGSLCVSRAVRDQATLLDVQQQLVGEPGVLGSGPNIRTGQLDVQVFVATEERQRDYDQRFGAGTIRLHGVLIPID